MWRSIPCIHANLSKLWRSTLIDWSSILFNFFNRTARIKKDFATVDDFSDTMIRDFIIANSEKESAELSDFRSGNNLDIVRRSPVQKMNLGFGQIFILPPFEFIEDLSWKRHVDRK